jgi:putative phosphoribosyl transferase
LTFANRCEAGKYLAEKLAGYKSDDAVVLGLPRGGVVVAAPISRAIGAPLDVIVVRKLGVPYQPELAMGAIGEGGARVLDVWTVRMAGLDSAGVEELAAREEVELERRLRTYRGDRPRVPIAGRTVIVVDDGIATGATARVACGIAREQGAHRVVFAAPVGPPTALEELSGVADEVVCPFTPSHFHAIGQWYDDFSPTEDDEVVELLSSPVRDV